MKTFTRIWLGISLISMGIGIALLIIAVACGARWDEAWNEGFDEHWQFTTLNESYENVKKLDFDINYGEVKIIKGDEFSISAENILEDEIESYVENGSWYIKEDDSRHYKFLGIDLEFGAFSWNSHFTPKITITLPEDFVASDIKLMLGAGSVRGEEIKAETGEFEVNAGEMFIDQLTISGDSRYTVDTGKMELKKAEVNDITVNCGVGNAVIDGVVTGDSSIKCGIGNIDLTLEGSKEEYSYDVTCDIGHIDIDGEGYNKISGKVIRNNGADNNLKLDCGIGHISVEFK